MEALQNTQGRLGWLHRQRQNDGAPGGITDERPLLQPVLVSALFL